MDKTGATQEGRIETEEQARNWVLELVEDMKRWRGLCDINHELNGSVKSQRRAMWTFLQKQGQVVGALKALWKCGKISEACYRELNQAAINTLIPTMLKGAN